MISIQEIFHQGMTIEEYRMQMTQNREQFDDNERTVSLATEDVRFFSQLPASLHVIVLTEDWCQAAIANIPVLARLATESGKLELRFFLRDQNQELMNQFLKEDSHAAIPAFIFFDQAFREIGRWYEIPAKIREMGIAYRQELFSTDPVFAGITPNTPLTQLPETVRMKIILALKEFRLRTRELSDHEVVREIREIILQDVAFYITLVNQQDITQSA